MTTQDTSTPRKLGSHESKPSCVRDDAFARADFTQKCGVGGQNHRSKLVCEFRMIKHPSDEEIKCSLIVREIAMPDVNKDLLMDEGYFLVTETNVPHSLVNVVYSLRAPELRRHKRVWRFENVRGPFQWAASGEKDSGTPAGTPGKCLACAHQTPETPRLLP